MTSSTRPFCNRVAVAILAGAALATAPAAAPLAKPHAAAAGKPALYVITLDNMKFGPAPAHVKVGDTIEWDNNDIFLHSATARDTSFNVELKPKARMRMTFIRPGVFPFYCRYHPGMTGTLVVSK
ncbi:cupredoxin domain-containing protein [Phenylobacterium sp.]|jgi:plastocyanin|uniref:cupredoxin domain-containing protein n=1 Tax=Phenylobacterium sp. TaxID=1871053 RepID=UPI002F3EEB68